MKSINTYIVVLLIICFSTASSIGQQPSAPAPSGNSPATQTPQTPATGAAPTGNSPQEPAPAPGSNARPLTPQVQIDQSIQPGSQPDQQNPATVPGQPLTPVPVTPNPQTPQTPGQQVGAPQGPPQPGKTSVPSPAPDQLLRVPLVAPNFRANGSTLPDLGRVGVDLANERPLTVRDAIELALNNNKDIEVTRENVKIAEFDLTTARGAYDPRFSSSSYYEHLGSPVSSFLSGTTSGLLTSSNLAATARLEGLTPEWGGGYRIDFSAIRSTTNNAFTALNPVYPTALTFSYTQPLLRGLHIDQSRRQVQIARKNLSLTDAQFRQRAIETITNVQRAYWDLVFSLRNLKIQQDAVRDARTQYEHNKRLVEEGQLAPIDVVAAEAQVSGFEQSVYSALEDVAKTENTLKGLIAEDRNSAIWKQSVLPTDPVDLQVPVVSVEDAVNTALATRPEVAQSNVLRDINRIDREYFTDQTKPQVDLTGSFGMSGLAGQLGSGVNPLTASSIEVRERVNLLSTIEGLPVLPPVANTSTLSQNVVGGLGQSLTDLVLNRYNNYRVGVQVSLPIKNRVAEGQLGRSLVEGQRIETQRQQLEQSIQIEVRNALQSVRTAQSRLRSAAAARSASEQQYSSEQRRFDAGQSTLFLVLERQTALTTARGNELKAQTDLNKAIADFQRATGNSLQANNVVARVK